MRCTSTGRRRPVGLVRALVGLLALVPSSPQEAKGSPAAPGGYAEDFEVLWKGIAREYAYSDRGTVDWDRAGASYRRRFTQVTTRQGFVELAEALLDTLCDAHTQLSANSAHGWRLVPSGATVWAEWLAGGRAVVRQVRPGSAAAAAGLRAGDEIVAVNGVPVAEAVTRRLGNDVHAEVPAARAWGLLSLLAGRHDEAVRLEVAGPAAQGLRRTYVIAAPDAPAPRQRAGAPLSERMLPANIGYVRLNNSLGDRATIAAMDAALDRLRRTAGLVLDLRDTPGGGNTTVARALMGRFVSRELPYQKHSDPGEERWSGIRHAWLELVSPRGPFTYTQQLVVLVDHWTGSMGEGMAIGLDGMHRATVVGTPMAGLIGAKRDALQLPHTGLSASFPVEKLFHVEGTPREAFVPAKVVDLAARAPGAADDAILAAGLAVIKAAGTPAE